MDCRIEASPASRLGNRFMSKVAILDVNSSNPQFMCWQSAGNGGKGGIPSQTEPQPLGGLNKAAARNIWSVHFVFFNFTVGIWQGKKLCL